MAAGPSINVMNSSPLSILPEFPHLAPIEVSHLPAIREFTGQFDPYSDFNPTSLWAWSAGAACPYLVGRLGENLVVEFGDYLGPTRFRSLLGSDSVDLCAEELLITSDNRVDNTLRLLPGVVADRLDRRRWLVVEDDDAADYVYDVAALATLVGTRHRQTRQRINRFERSAPDDLELRWLEPAELSARKDDYLAVFDSWAANNSDGAATSGPERRAFERILSTANSISPSLHEWCGELRVNGRLVAVWITEVLDGKWLMGHFCKTTRSDEVDSRGLTGWLVSQQCRRAHDEGLQSLNFQQDLGILGLKEFKKSLRPSRMLRKYSASWIL